MAFGKGLLCCLCVSLSLFAGLPALMHWLWGLWNKIHSYIQCIHYSHHISILTQWPIIMNHEKVTEQQRVLTLNWLSLLPAHHPALCPLFVLLSVTNLFFTAWEKGCVAWECFFLLHKLQTKSCHSYKIYYLVLLSSLDLFDFLSLIYKPHELKLATKIKHKTVKLIPDNLSKWNTSTSWAAIFLLSLSLWFWLRTLTLKQTQAAQWVTFILEQRHKLCLSMERQQKTALPSLPPLFCLRTEVLFIFIFWLSQLTAFMTVCLWVTLCECSSIWAVG